MKRRLYIVLALLSASGVAWSDGYRGYGPNPYGVYGNPTATPYSANPQQLYDNQGNYRGSPNNYPAASNPYAPNGNTPPRYPANSPYDTGSPYTPYTQYSTPTPYGVYGKPYSPYPATPPSLINNPSGPNNVTTPYDPNNANPSPTTNPYTNEMQQFYDNQGYFRGSYGADPNPVPAPSGLYGNPSYPGPINSPYGADSPYSPGSSPYEQ